MLSLVSLAHGVLRAEALHLALQAKVPSAKWLHLWVACVQKCCTRHFSSRRQWWAMCKDAAPGIWICSTLSRAVAPNLEELCPPPHWWEPYKAAHQWPLGESVYSRARACTFPLFDQRIKLSFASDPNLVSCYLQATPGRRTLTGAWQKKVITNFGDHEGMDGGFLPAPTH